MSAMIDICLKFARTRCALLVAISIITFARTDSQDKSFQKRAAAIGLEWVKDVNGRPVLRIMKPIPGSG